MWLSDAPPWAEELVCRLLEDRLVFLFVCGDEDDVFQRVRDPQARLPDAESRALLATPAARSAYDILLAPTDSACDRFSEDKFAALFAYIADPPDAD